MTDLLSIGKITKTFGIKGDLKVASTGTVLSDLPTPFDLILLVNNSPKIVRLNSVKLTKATKAVNEFIIHIENYENPEEAEKLRGHLLYINKTDLPATNKEEYYTFKLLGLPPKNNGKIIKEYQIKEVLDNPAHPILLFVSEEGNEILIPFIHEFVKEINFLEKTIEISNWEDWFEV